MRDPVDIRAVPPSPRPFARTPARRRASVAAAALACLAVSGLSACRNSFGISTTEPEVGPGSVYALVSANEIALPASFTADGRTVELRRGALTLGDDSTFIFSYAQRSAASNGLPTEGTVTVRGQLRRTGTALVLVQLGDTMFTGTWAATTVRLAVRRATVTGERFVFVR